MNPRVLLQLATILALTAFLGCAAPLPSSGATSQTPAPGKGGEGMTSMDALEGKTWTLVQFDDGSPVPAGRPITAIFGGGKVSGSGGCNRYSATVISAAPGQLKVGAISARTTRTRAINRRRARRLRRDGFLVAMGKSLSRVGLGGQPAREV